MLRRDSVIIASTGQSSGLGLGWCHTGIICLPYSEGGSASSCLGLLSCTEASADDHGCAGLWADGDVRSILCGAAQAGQQRHCGPTHCRCALPLPKASVRGLC